MRRIRLTKAIADALEYEGGSQTIYWDAQLPSFALAIYPSGRKSFFVSYYMGGRERRMILGRLGEITLEEARGKASEVLGKVRRGEDPLTAREQERAGLTLGEFWERSFLPDAIRRWKPRTASEAKRMWAQRIAPILGKKRLDHLKTGDVSAWHRSQIEHPTQANCAFRLLKSVVNKAILWELIPGPNPASRVKQYKDRPRERFLSGEEFQRLWAAIGEEEALGGVRSVARGDAPDGGDRRGMGEQHSRGISPHAAGLFRLLALTGCRLGEIQTAQWGFLDWDAACLRLPDSKTGAKVVPLNVQALKELRRLWDMRTQERWVIEGNRAGEALVNAQKPWRRVRARAGLENVRLHDLRHSLASIMVNQNVGLPVIGKALGHTVSATTQRYAHLSLDPVRAAVEMAGRFIEEAIAPPSAAVLDVHPPAAAPAKKSRAAR